jgi:predicted nicotinamide N-methyase
VLELAAGLGLPGILAAQIASEVTISDYVPEAVELMQSSAMLNQCTNVHCRLLNWYELPTDLKAEVLLLSDINYEASAFEVLYHVLIDFLARGSTILLSSPQRLMAKPFIERLLPYCVKQHEELITLDEEQTYISVLVLTMR